MVKYIFKSKIYLILNSLFSFLGFGSLFLTFYSYSLITKVVQNNSMEDAYKVTVLIILTILALIVFSILSTITTRKILEVAIKSLRDDIFISVYNSKISDYYKRGKSYFEAVILNDIDILENMYFRSVIEIINDSIQIIIMATAIALIGIENFIIVALLCIPILIAPFILKKKLNRKGNDFSQKMKRFNNKAEETIDSFYLGKYFKSQKNIFNRYKIETSLVEDSRKSLNYYRAFNTSISIINVMILKVISLYSFTDKSLNLLLDLSSVALLFSLVNNIGNPLKNILTYIESINSTKEIRKNILSLFSGEIEDKEDFELKDIDLEINNLSLRVSDKTILDNFTYIFNKGNKYMIVGESGCGKSSLFKVLLRYFEIYEGEIRLGYREIRDLKHEEIYKKVSYISQEPYILSDNLRNNITLFTEGFSDEDVLVAIEKAGLKSFYDNLEKGLDTIIDRDNRTISGGEMQRIGLARGFLFDSSIYLFDEATSALDKETSLLVEKNILALEDKIVISIVHKINAVSENYDYLLFMDKGKVKYSGPYKEIKNNNKEVKELLEA
ncbi:ABC transporter ATP-binding protein/permease [Clostridium algidicarnis]|uniref:ATP-binding cassette domain-containing protein n=1 Tax=Clostridium algidicarnis TaxID=37659 RepID=UPI001C0E00D4|nr:ABC transporter ATP-binding protein [Clostridium algidicarnis]MBU3210558.1 ABC transporter ATP-binding protein/permease [Clostridium algidicarnis]